MTKTPAIKRTPAQRPPAALSPDPKPLALHMSLQVLTSLSALSALPLWKNGSLTLKRQNGNLQSVPPPKNVDLEALSSAVTREAVARLSQFSSGIKKYQAHPRTARAKNPPAIWSSGSARLLDYGIFCQTPSARPVLVIPSLINRSYILDLTIDRSLMRHLAANGLRPLLMDWGAPEDAEQNFGLDDYIGGYLQAALDLICSQSSARPAIVGYCMGGNLALALAQKNQHSLSALALLATPWDFHSDGGANAYFLELMAPALDVLISTLHTLPVDMLQALFASLDPAQTAAKFRRFATTAADTETAKRFVLLEDWVNDGVPLPGKVARECLFGWYRDNSPHQKNWQISGTVIDPAKIDLPTFAAIPAKDHIVPPASALALANALTDTHIITPNAGHIGMIAGRRSRDQLYIPLTEWLSKQFK